MPLSEREQRMLQQMEQALYAEDPQFATRIQRQGAGGPSRRRLAIGALGIIVGLGLVVVGAMNSSVWVGAAGFALMVAGAAYAFTPAKTTTALGTVEPDGSVHPAGRGRANGKGSSG
ncbi:MAG TPA: DUF3040 domain-containing protein, partial [Candidatus Lustribacter sp.]|nr:DUF3040 domain-containing protein [Candidatus Lustribacter sp.]